MTVELGNINKGIPMGSYTPDQGGGGGGGGTTTVTGVDPIAVTNGSVAIKIDEQTLQVNEQGELSANLDEIGSELNDLSGRVTVAEADILLKQDKFTTASPLNMKNVASVSLRDVAISEDNLSFGNNNLLTAQVATSISTSSTFAQAIQSGIVIPYKFGQVLQFHCGNDTFVQGSNRRHGSPCVALFGHFTGSGDFITALAINGFASYVSSAIRGNMGGALKAGAVSMLPSTTYQTTSGQSSVERGENTINMGEDYSTYVQLMVNDAGNLMQGIYGHYGTNSTNVGWAAMARTDVIQDSSLDSGQTVADIIAAIDTAVIIKGSNFGTIKKANFGLYDYSERLPWTQAGYDTFIANKGDNLIDLDNPSTQPQLQLNLGDGLSVTGGKLTATPSTPDNMVTTNTKQVIAGRKILNTSNDKYLLQIQGDSKIKCSFGYDSSSGASIIETSNDGGLEIVQPDSTKSFKYNNGTTKYDILHTGNLASNLPTATTSAKGLVKPDGSTITITSDGTISAVGGGGGGTTTYTEKYGIEGDYSSKYGILECPNGIFKVSGMTMTLQPGVVMQCAGLDTKTTNTSAMAHTVESTTDFDIFYTSGQFIEATSVVFSTQEPDDGDTGYIAWWDPSRTDKQWQFKSNSTGNVWAAAPACRLAHIHTDGTTITRVDYIGNRQMDDGVFADVSADNTFSGVNTFNDNIIFDCTANEYNNLGLRAKYVDGGTTKTLPVFGGQLGRNKNLTFGIDNALLRIQGSPIQFSEVPKDLSGKVFLTSGNVASYVTESSHTGLSGYRLWSDGYCEQWGYVTKGSGVATTITLSKAYADTNYNITGAVEGASGSTSNMTVSSALIVVTDSKTKSSFQTYQSTVAGKYWRTTGYVS